MTASKPILALVAAAAAMLPLRSADANGVTDQGVALYFDQVLTIFADGFETGTTNAWSDAQP
jgi:hypothetical protein